MLNEQLITSRTIRGIPNAYRANKCSFERSESSGPHASSEISEPWFTDPLSISESQNYESISVTIRYPSFIQPPTSNRFFSQESSSFRINKFSNRDETSKLSSIFAILDDEPVEDGITHPIEKLLSEFIRTNGSSIILKCIFGLGNNTRIADALHVVGRVNGIDKNVREQLLRSGLEKPSVEVRDAAVQAAELWEDPSMVPILRQHNEKVPWLAEYINRIVSEFES